MNADYQPELHLVTNVTVEAQAVITTNEAHGYEANNYIRVFVPSDYGMRLNGVRAYVSAVTADTLTTDIDTRQQAAFVAPVERPFTQAHVVPITQLLRNEATR